MQYVKDVFATVLTATLTLGVMVGCVGPPDESIIPPAVISGMVVDSAEARETVSIFGTVSDSSSNEGIIGATIELVELQLRTQSGFTGAFMFENVATGTYRLSASHPDFDTSELLIEVTERSARSNYSIVLSEIRHDSQRVYHEGWNHATADIAAGRAAFFRVGGLPSPEKPQGIDSEYGLPVIGNFSCIVTDEIEAYAQGYNACVRHNVSEHGPPENSRLEWYDLIINPKDFFKLMEKSGGLAEGAVLLDTLKTDFEGYRLLLVNEDEWPILRILGPSDPVDLVFPYNKLKNVRIANGPPGSYLMIVKSDNKYYGHKGYGVIDLQFGGSIGW
ncbi:hypothetical protein GF420_11205 [candidate division GN15 bacterium]|nr:hypothetical protein [candidate division GN15 bacterium]